MEINKTVIVVSRWFLYYLIYIDDARSNTNQVNEINYLLKLSTTYKPDLDDEVDDGRNIRRKLNKNFF